MSHDPTPDPSSLDNRARDAAALDAAGDGGDDAGPRRARELFARASDGLDHGMAFRLRRARRQAQQPAAPRRLPGFAGMVPAGLAAAAALALGVAWWQPATMPPPVAAGPALSEQQELDILLSGDEDPELYVWLADAPVATGDRP